MGSNRYSKNYTLVFIKMNMKIYKIDINISIFHMVDFFQVLIPVEKCLKFLLNLNF